MDSTTMKRQTNQGFEHKQSLIRILWVPQSFNGFSKAYLLNSWSGSIASMVCRQLRQSLKLDGL